MTFRVALPIAAAALALSACSGGGTTENASGANDSAVLEENVISEDGALNESDPALENAAGEVPAEGGDAADAAGNATVNAL